MRFDYFQSKCQFRLDGGIKLNKYKAWTKKMLKIVHFPEKFRDLFV